MLLAVGGSTSDPQGLPIAGRHLEPEGSAALSDRRVPLKPTITSPLLKDQHCRQGCPAQPG